MLGTGTLDDTLMLARKQLRLASRLFFGLATLILLMLVVSLAQPRSILSNAWTKLEASVMTGVAEMVIVREPLSRADYIVVLNGRVDSRAFRAADAYLHGFAPRILIAEVAERSISRRGEPPTEHLHERIGLSLQELGVRPTAIEYMSFPQGAMNTRDEARALREFLLRNPARRVIVVTSDYHTLRARMILRQELRGMDVELKMAPARTDDVQPGDWWKTESGRRVYGTEFLKLGCALFRCT